VAVASAGHMQVCTSLQTDNHTSTSPLSFFTGRPTNSVKALKEILLKFSGNKILLPAYIMASTASQNALM